MEAAQASKSVPRNSNDTKTRISILENDVSHLSDTLEKLEVKMDNNYATLHSRISDLRDDLRSDFEVKNEKLMHKLEEHNQNSIANNNEIKDKIAHFEKWRWMIMGGALVLGYFLAHVKLENLF